MITLLNKFDDKYVIQKKDVLEIVNSYINENNLELYLNDVIFSSSSKYLGSYNLVNNQMVLNDERILKFCYKMYDKLMKKHTISEDSYTYFINYYYLYILFHELQHVWQKAYYENTINKGNELYVYLYELCRQLQRNNEAFYNSNHDLFPMEIDANNNGYAKAYQLISYTKLKGKELKLMHAQYLFSLLYNYNQVNKYRISTPIDKLWQKNNKIDIQKIFYLLDQKKLTKMERINLGLDITPKEYLNIEKKKVLLYK